MDLNIIGWTVRDGKKQLACPNGFTVDCGEANMDEVIEVMIKECEQHGLVFPELKWENWMWIEKTVQKIN